MRPRGVVLLLTLKIWGPVSIYLADTYVNVTQLHFGVTHAFRNHNRKATEPFMVDHLIENLFGKNKGSKGQKIEREILDTGAEKTPHIEYLYLPITEM